MVINLKLLDTRFLLLFKNKLQKLKKKHLKTNFN